MSDCPGSFEPLSDELDDRHDECNATIDSLRQRVEEWQQKWNDEVNLKAGAYIELDRAEAEVQRLRGEVERLTSYLNETALDEDWREDMAENERLRVAGETAIAALHPPVGEGEQ